MPIYEYRCDTCGFQKEYLQRITEPLLTDCPECQKPTFTKLLSAAGFQLKGSGWYVTDFKNKGTKPQAQKDTNDRKDQKDTADAGKPAEKPAETKKDDAKSEPASTGACPAGT